MNGFDAVGRDVLNLIWQHCGISARLTLSECCMSFYKLSMKDAELQWFRENIRLYKKGDTYYDAREFLLRARYEEYIKSAEFFTRRFLSRRERKIIIKSL